MMEALQRVSRGVQPFARREGASGDAAQVPARPGAGLRDHQGAGTLPLRLSDGALGRGGGPGAPSPSDRSSRNFSRSFFASATDQPLDRQGRIQLPEALLYAGLEKDATVVGVADHIEIWAGDTWQTVAAEADEYYAGIEEVLSEEGI